MQDAKLLCPRGRNLRWMRDRSMRGETELAREIQLTDWSTASTKPSLAQFISLFFAQREKIAFWSSKLHMQTADYLRSFLVV